MGKMKAGDKTPILCNHCGEEIGILTKTDRKEHGLPVYESEWTHAQIKITHPFPNKAIEMKDRFCDYCGRTVH